MKNQSLDVIEEKIEMLVERAHEQIDFDCLLEHGLSEKQFSLYNALCNRRDKLKSEGK